MTSSRSTETPHSVRAKNNLTPTSCGGAARGQVWYTDFIIGTIILLTMVVIFFISMHNLEETRETHAGTLIREGSIISDSLMTSGLPKGWTNDTVVQLGVVDNQRVNLTQLDAYQQVPYATQRRLLRTVADFVFFFEQRDGCLISRNNTRLYGSPDMTAPNGSCVTVGMIDTGAAGNLIPITRYVLYDSDPVRMVTYVWN
ncbi:hypothetical protein HY492_02920 [Candidatus Woesearchaeota archaeon]|nr:hypothetical protein [Candidatus Woesearchaeota archaeon]